MRAWVMLMLGWTFVPFYYRANVFTVPEFLGKRFNAKVRWILSIVPLVAYVFTKASGTVYAGASMGRFDIILTAVTMVLIVGSYLYFGFWLNGVG